MLIVVPEGEEKKQKKFKEIVAETSQMWKTLTYTAKKFKNSKQDNLKDILT